MAAMDITLATFSHWPTELAPPGLRFDNCYPPATDYPSARNAVLTGQYPQRRARYRISDVFADAGWRVTEGAEPAQPDENVFRLWEEPGSLPDTGVVAVATLSDSPGPMSIFWPGVAEGGTSQELVSPMDLAPTLAAIAGLDVRPNARLSFDGLNLIPVIRYGASGHAALFFDNGIRMQDASLIDGHASKESRRAALQEEWDTWREFMDFGPLQ